MSLFAPFRFTALMHPWALLLLAAVPLLFVAEWFARAPGVLHLSTGETLGHIGAARRSRFRWVPACLRAVALSLLIIALARPLMGFQPQKDRANVVDIMLCVDVSGSMKAMDFEYGGERRDRLYVTKEAVQHFLRSRKVQLDDRYGLDRVGLILYAGYAWTQCPLTLDYGVLEHELDLAQIDEQDPKKQGTAIGSAIGLAVSRLRKSEARSKVIILLTDGMNNAGELSPLTAAGMAKEFGIRIYTIGAGSRGEAYIPQKDFLFGERLVRVNAPIDEDTLRKIAEATGGKYYRATDTASLEGAYAEINKLETTEIELDDYYEHKEAFVPYAALGALMMALSIVVRRQWFETIP
ncbi:MAG TPA: VWA domain-containing protein [Candidatus Hydrogenedentes bacterium]|nr:VWA domain-containing protein [Candidatus Hydrogenedentota bacterium]HPG67424.1 VWA domain-containing protein [Candidatus Hydrogenedentota bacterium]